ncbi:HD domain-containing protein [Haematococcus lacustris]|uniref:HD domain-containing protein n=1 Tax=Haematococcus lacustris TaxID=44745 RepID=A0A699ZXD9_HAELA|nr:HD domain-containing protein [Haematococcus lacustris]
MSLLPCRLDAIGAVGIARCFTFGGHFNRTLYDPDVPPRTNLTKEQYMAESAKATTINHFYEKLLKLSAMMKTAAGRRAAQQRHDFMLQYLEQFHAEWEGRR